MKKEIKMFTVICDNCGVDAFEEHEYSGFNDKDYVEVCAMEAGFIKQGEKHYCPNCYDYDDENNLTIKNK